MMSVCCWTRYVLITVYSCAAAMPGFGREKYNSGARDYILSGLLELLNSLLLSLPGARANVGSDGGSALVSYLMDDVLFHKHTDPGTGYRGRDGRVVGRCCRGGLGYAHRRELMLCPVIAQCPTQFVCCVNDMTGHTLLCCNPLRLLGPSSLASFLQVMHHCAVVACDGLL